ncbi:MAG TPA: hypothetical protein P5552_17120, partial [Candidatus Competibacteraceae bacterium]|nr:hypothetical protein [Candidatus Competibacteraceae bacterium]
MPDEEKTILLPQQPSVDRERPAWPYRRWRVVVVALALIGLVWGGTWIGLRSPSKRSEPPITPVAPPPMVETPSVVKAPPVAETLPMVEKPMAETLPVVKTPTAETPPVTETPRVAETSVVVTRPSLEPEMVPISKGCFQMGSPTSEKDRDQDERHPGDRRDPAF